MGIDQKPTFLGYTSPDFLREAKERRDDNIGYIEKINILSRTVKELEKKNDQLLLLLK
jgi:hypothetical protein